MNSKRILLFLVAVLFFLVFRFWFFPGILTGYDLPYRYNETIKSNFWLYSWDLQRGGGLGDFSAPLLWNYASQVLPSAILLNAGLNWEFCEKLLFFIPFLFFSSWGSFILLRTFIHNNLFLILGVLIYTTNTYILALLSGGQIMIALAYSLIPFTIYFIKTHNHLLSLKHILVIDLLMSVIFLLDIRIGFLCSIVFSLYFLLVIDSSSSSKKILKNIIILISIFVFVLVSHSFWILPVIKYQNRSTTFGNEFTSVDEINFFSFAKFENTISLLHPNWPENIFGKVSFMQPEFLIIPILAYSSLLCLKGLDRKQKKNILFFIFLGLAGSFLAKGSSPPFGFINVWIFEHVPGFIMFRDPTKFYVLIALSYSILIPFFLYHLSQYALPYAKKIYKKFSENYLLCIIFLTFTIFWLITIRQVILGQLGGTFNPTQIPPDYIKLEKFLSSQNRFYRTFFIPSIPRFGFYSQIHPGIPAKDFYKIYDNPEIIKEFNKTENQKVLNNASVKYVIVPFDSEKELFLENRLYNEKQYVNSVSSIKNNSKLLEIKGFGKIKVFEIENPKDHFWSPSKGIVLSYEYINPTKYNVTIKNAKKEDLIIFSESFDNYWIAQNGNKIIKSQQYNKLFNSFKLIRDGDYTLQVYYEPQKWVDRGLYITVSIFIITICFLLYSLKRRKQ